MTNIHSSILFSNPLVSVVITSYNRAHTIVETIDSILSQNCNFDIEILIGDDMSTDCTRVILLDYQKRYPKIIRLLFHGKNLGIGQNWATVMMHVRGKYVALCDDDDYWHDTDKLQQQIEILESNDKIGLVYTDYRTLDVFSGIVKEKKVQNTIQISLQQSLFCGKYHLIPSSCVLRYELIQKYVSLDDYIKFDFPIQDWNTWILIAKYTEFYHLALSTVTYRISSKSMSNPKDYETVVKKYSKEKLMYKYICDKFPTELPFDEQGYDAYVNHVLLGLAYKKLDFPSARKYGSLLSAVGNTNLKVKCSTTIFTFYSYGLASKIKAAFKKY